MIPIRWGHPQQGQPDEGKSFSSDEQLFVAQNRILQAMASVEPRLTADDGLPWSRAQVALGLQRQLLVSGFGNMVYRTGRDGCRTIQRIMFRALRQRIELLLSAGSLAPNDRIRLHLFAESLGVSISFEFLALLFGPPLVGHQRKDNSHVLRREAGRSGLNAELKAGDRIRTGDVQLEKLLCWLAETPAPS